MSATVCVPGIASLKYFWAITLLVLMSTIVVAQTVERLESSPNYDDLAREEIYNSNKEWRADMPQENEFRSNQPAISPPSRIQIGVDPYYEDVRRQDQSQFDSQVDGFGKDRPSTIFRYKF